MLILAYTDGFGVDFYQFRQRVLDTSANGNGGTQGNVIIREFLRTQFGSGIHRSPCFVGNDVIDLFIQFFQHFRHKLLGFSGSGAVADGNQVYIIFFDKSCQFLFRFSCLVLRRCGIYHGGFQGFACFVNDGNFTACTISRV